MKRDTNGYKKRVKLPWFPFYPDDWVYSETVLSMTLAQQGCFILMLCLQWKNGDLPNDVTLVARMLSIATAEPPEHADVQVVLDKAFVKDAKTGRLFNRRLAHEENVQRARLRSNADRQKRSRDRNGDVRVTSRSASHENNAEEKEKEKERDKEKETTTTTAHADAFAPLWKAYPTRRGGAAKARALRVFTANCRAGISVGGMLAGIERYAKFCAAEGKTGGPYVLQCSTFLGPDKHWEEEWVVPPISSGAMPPQGAPRGGAGVDRALTPLEQKYADHAIESARRTMTVPIDEVW